MLIGKGDSTCHTYSKNGAKFYDNISWDKKKGCEHAHSIKGKKRCMKQGMDDCKVSNFKTCKLRGGLMDVKSQLHA